MDVKAGLPSLATTGSNAGVAESCDLLVNSGVQSDEKEIKKTCCRHDIEIVVCIRNGGRGEQARRVCSKALQSTEGAGRQLQPRFNVALNCCATKLIAFSHLLCPPMNYFFLRLCCKPRSHVTQKIYLTDTLCRYSGML